VRHEVGHGVHELFKANVDGWLASRFGWQRLPATPGGIDQWVALMGGWGTLSPNERGDIRNYLVQAIGRGSNWVPGPAPNPAAGHPWHHQDFGPRLAFEKTGARWYNNNATWHRHGGKAFFLNYWYRELMVVDTATLDLINTGSPSKYAAMSPLEFFAEVYALYYDLDDPRRANLAADAVQWLDQAFGTPEPGAPSMPGLAPAHRSGGARIRRPGPPPPEARPKAKRPAQKRPAAKLSPVRPPKKKPVATGKRKPGRPH